MARRSNQTSIGGIGSEFNDAPISSGAATGVDGSGSNLDSTADENGLRTVDAGAVGNTADSNDAGYGVNKDGTPAKKRGRKAGQKNGSAQTGSKVSVSGLEKTLIAIHSGIAGLLHDQSWNLSDEEAKAYSEAAANVARHYNATISPKVADWIVLIGVLGTLYGARLSPLIFRLLGKKGDKTPQPQEQEPASFNMNLPPIGGMPMRH